LRSREPLNSTVEAVTPPPEGPDGRRDSKLDPGIGVPTQQIIDQHLVDRFHLVIRNPEPPTSCGRNASAGSR